MKFKILSDLYFPQTYKKIVYKSGSYESMWLHPFIRAFLATPLRFPIIFPLHSKISGMTLVMGLYDGKVSLRG